MDIILTNSCTFSFRSSHTFFLNILSEAAARSLKRHEIFSGAATHLPKHKQYPSKAAAQFFFFRSSHPHFLISFRSSGTFLKNTKYSQKQPHICLNIKNMFRSSCTNFSRLLHKIYTLCGKIFITLQWF